MTIAAPDPTIAPAARAAVRARGGDGPVPFDRSAEAHAARSTRVERLNTASLRNVIDPDLDIPGEVGPGEVLPRELLSLSGLGIELTDEQWVRLSREELGSVLDSGVRFESLLMAGFGRHLAYAPDLTDARVVYALHELGEETRHSRMFIRVLQQLDVEAVNPFTRGILRRLDRFATGFALRHDALFMVMILTGEEGPDLLQARSVEHPDTDPFVREVNRYHRAEEARHLAYGRLRLGELWQEAPFVERWVIRHLAPAITAGVFDGLIHPGVYRTVGLRPWKTWNAARKSSTRQHLRAEVLRPVCASLVKAGAFGRRGVPTRTWRKVCRLDGRGVPIA